MKNLKIQKPLREKKRYVYTAYQKLMGLDSPQLVRFVLTSIVAVLTANAFFAGDYEQVMYCGLALIFFSMPALFQDKFKLDIPNTLEIFLLFFIFSAQILGEIASFYAIIPIWDDILHTVNGFLAAAVGFGLVDLLNRSDKFSIKLSPLFLVITSFCFSMTIGVLWEIYEFSVDIFLGLDTQKDTIITTIRSVVFDPQGLTNVITVPIESLVVNGEDWMAMYGGYIDIGIIDTMMDLIVNLVGAIVFGVIAYISLIGKAKGKFIKRFIPVATGRVQLRKKKKAKGN